MSKTSYYNKNQDTLQDVMNEKGITSLNSTQGTTSTNKTANKNATGTITHRASAYKALDRTDKMMSKTSYYNKNQDTLQNVQNELLRKKMMS